MPGPLQYKTTLTASGGVAQSYDVGPLKRFAVQPDNAARVRVVSSSGTDAATSAIGLKVAGDGVYEDYTGSSHTVISVFPLNGATVTALIFAEG